MEQLLSSQVYLSVRGTELPLPVMKQLAEVVVDQHAHMPDMFMLRFYDPGLALLDEGPFELAAALDITADTLLGEKVRLISGELTALEPVFAEGMVAELVLRGYDSSHRLFRERKTRAFLNKKDSDLAEEIARRANLQPEVEPTKTVYEHIFQDNQSDLAFLMQRARRIGYECFVNEGKLYFRHPSAAGDRLTLTYGDDLQTFALRLTLAKQVDEVAVRGWDADKQRVIIGRAEQGHLYPNIGERKNGQRWAAAFGRGQEVVVNQPVNSQAEADILAQARLDEISGAFIEAEGVAFRRPEIRAGKVVHLEQLGKRFSGTYLVTRATHRYTADGWTTTFAVSGLRSGLLGEQFRLAQGTAARWPGVFVAIVTNTDDPRGWGRVKLKFPWLSEETESDWARVLAPGGGPEAGFVAIPAVNDEVLVAFEHGDIARPCVLGGLWNGQHALPPEAAAVSGSDKPHLRSWHSRKGHAIVIDDLNDEIALYLRDGSRLVVQDQTVAVTAAGQLQLTAQGNLTIRTKGDMNLEAEGKVNIKGAAINLN